MKFGPAALVITLAMGILVAPLPAHPQQRKQVRLGYLSGNPPSDTEEAVEAFRKRLRELGYVEGQNLVIEYRYADGKFNRLPQLVADLVHLKVDIILTYGTPATLAAKSAVSTIPIVFAAVADPLVIGAVATLRQPGGNITGVTTTNPELSAKRLGLLREAVPTASRVAVLSNPDFKPTADMVIETRIASQSLGVQIQILEVRDPDKLKPAFRAMTSARADALIVLPDPMFISQRRRIVELAANTQLPAMYHLKQFVAVGGLMAYGPSYAESFQQSAVLIDKILRGAKPGDLPAEQPWRFELVINLKAAKALGLTIPQSVLIRADQVIQ